MEISIELRLQPIWFELANDTKSELAGCIFKRLYLMSILTLERFYFPAALQEEIKHDAKKNVIIIPRNNHVKRNMKTSKSASESYGSMYSFD